MSSASQTSGSVRSGGRRLWILVFLGFFLVFGAWSFAAPYDGPADEVQHVIRAAGVVSGQIAPKPVKVIWGADNAGAGAMQRVPKGLYHPARCWGFDTTKSAACQEPIGGGPLIDAPTSAGRYNPVYYAVVGAPLRLWPSWGGLVIARLISAALSAALLAWSFVTLVRWSRFGLMLAGLIAAATPMLAHLAGAVNPNGLEITAGIALFCGGIPLLLGTSDGSKAGLLAKTPLIWLTGTGAALLAVLRSLGPLWLGVGLFALLVPQSRSYLRQLCGYRLIRRWIYVIAAALVFAVAWVIIEKAGELVPTPGKFHYGTSQAALIYIQSWEIFLKGMVGVAGWFDIFMPVSLYWLWVGAAASLIFFALVISDWSDRWRFFVMFVGAAVVPGVLQVSEANVTGFIIGGRYMLPLVVGMPLLAAFIVERRLLNAKQSRSMTKLFTVLLLPCHLALLVYGMVRWQKGAYQYPGLSRLNPLNGSWHPPTGSVIPLVVMVAGLVLLGRLFWQAPALAAVTPAPDAAIGEGLTTDARSTAQQLVAADVVEEAAAAHAAPVPDSIH